MIDQPRLLDNMLFVTTTRQLINDCTITLLLSQKGELPTSEPESEMLNSAEELFERIDVNRKKIQFF